MSSVKIAFILSGKIGAGEPGRRRNKAMPAALICALALMLAACQQTTSVKVSGGGEPAEISIERNLARTTQALDRAYRDGRAAEAKVLVLLRRMHLLLLQKGAVERALFYAKRIYAIRLRRPGSAPGAVANAALGRAALDLAELYQRLGSSDAAVKTFFQALRHFQKLPEALRRSVAAETVRAELRLGLLLYDLGRLDSAEGLLRGLLAKQGRSKFRKIFQAQQVSGQEIINRLVTVRRVRGDLAGVAALLKLAQHRDTAGPLSRAGMARRIATLDGETGNYRLVRANLLGLLKRHRAVKNGNPRVENDLLAAIIETYIKDAHYDSAAKLIDQLLTRQRRQSGVTRSERIQALLRAAAQSRAIRRLDKARSYQARAAQLAMRLAGDRAALKRQIAFSRVRNFLAAGLGANAGKLASRLDRQTVALFGEASPRRIATLRLAARAARMTKDLAKADRLIFLACEIARRNIGPWAPLTATLYGELAAIREVRKMPRERLVAITAASFAHRVQFRNALMSAQPNRRDRLRRARKIFVRQVAAVEVRLEGKVKPGPGARKKLLARAFEAMQLARAADMAQRAKFLTTGFIASAIGGAAFLKQRQDQAYRLDAARQQLWRLRWRGKTLAAKRQLKLVKKLWQVGQNLDRQMASRHPDFVRLSGFTSVALEQAQAALRDGETLLLYLTGRNESFVFVARRKVAALLAIRAAGPQLARRVKRLRQRLDPTREANRRRDFQYDVTGAYGLYRLLLAPVKNRTGLTGRLLIVPDGPLASLPFAALIGKLPRAGEKINANYYVGAPWLIRDHPILMLPSVRALSPLRTTDGTGKTGIANNSKSRMPAVQGKKLPFVAFADPAFSGRDRGLRGIGTRALFATASVSSAGYVDRENLLALPNLEETGGEMLTLAQRLSAPRGNITLRENVTEAAVKALSGKRFTVLSLATHGLIAGEFDNYGEPGLAFAPPDAGARRRALARSDDGVLRVSEIIGLKLAAKWLVLSALSTVDADGRANARGLAPLLLALQHAGAETILATHWSVAPIAMVYLVAESIKNTSPKRPVDQVLRDTMLQMILNNGAPELRHPMMWAPLFAVTSRR